MNNATIDHYNQSADRYAQANHGLETARVDLEGFLKHFPNGARGLRILDAGSGTGRDTLAMTERGIQVDAFDGSEAMAALSSKLTGQRTKVMRFEALELPQDHYDGIWAMASLLHVARSELPAVIVELAQSLRPGGLMFASFKNGQCDRVDRRDGRAFTDMDEQAVQVLVDQKIEGLEMVETSLRSPPGSQTNQEPWFSCVLRRQDGLTPTITRRRLRLNP